jgi:hypothetical protein
VQTCAATRRSELHRRYVLAHACLGSQSEDNPMLWRVHRFRDHGAAVIARPNLLMRKRAQIGIAAVFLLAALSAWVAILVK